MFTTSENLQRRFIGLWIGQDLFIRSEKTRRGESIGVILREVIDLGIKAYKKSHKLPAIYPDNGL